MAEDIPLLALPAGSILQFLCMTLPLLGLYLYFLYLVITRPSLVNGEAYMEDRIRLTDILYAYVGTLILFTSLIVYLLWFVRKRRKLSKRYESEGIVVLGNVEFSEMYEGESYITTCLERIGNCCRRNNYGYVIYDLSKVARHPACIVEEQNADKFVGFVKKKVRVYYRYPREQVSIMVLPNYPYSGQPKIDLEIDWASFSEHVSYPGEDGGPCGEKSALPRTLSRDRFMGVVFIAMFWVTFLFGAAIYTCIQIEAIEDYYVDESADWAWVVFAMGCVLVPLLSFGGNFVRWKLYKSWILYSGMKIDMMKSGSEYADATSPPYIQMT